MNTSDRHGVPIDNDVDLEYERLLYMWYNGYNPENEYEYDPRWTNNCAVQEAGEKTRFCWPLHGDCWIESDNTVNLMEQL